MTQDPEKKIIVDEDWKSQVEREREAARQTPGGEPPQAAAPQAESPPATLVYLVTSLSMQASVFLGLMADPATGKAETNLPVAKHLIDLLEVVQQKTEGNRTLEETETIEALLHQLRIAYVQISK